MHELLAPTRKEIRPTYESGFIGMMNDPPGPEALEDARESLIVAINTDLDDQEREFLISVKKCEPKWDLLGVPHIAEFPAIQWNLMSLQRMKKDKLNTAIAALERVLLR